MLSSSVSQPFCGVHSETSNTKQSGLHQIRDYALHFFHSATIVHGYNREMILQTNGRFRETLVEGDHRSRTVYIISHTSLGTVGVWKIFFLCVFFFLPSPPICKLRMALKMRNPELLSQSEGTHCPCREHDQKGWRQWAVSPNALPMVSSNKIKRKKKKETTPALLF